MLAGLDLVVGPCGQMSVTQFREKDMFGFSVSLSWSV